MQQQVADLKKCQRMADWKASSKDRHAKGREKSNKPDETIKEIFSLINQFGSYGAMGFGMGGGMDERNEDTNGCGMNFCDWMRNLMQLELSF